MESGPGLGLRFGSRLRVPGSVLGLRVRGQGFGVGAWVGGLGFGLGSRARGHIQVWGLGLRFPVQASGLMDRGWDLGSGLVPGSGSTLGTGAWGSDLGSRAHVQGSRSPLGLGLWVNSRFGVESRVQGPGSTIWGWVMSVRVWDLRLGLRAGAWGSGSKVRGQGSRPGPGLWVNSGYTVENPRLGLGARARGWSSGSRVQPQKSGLDCPRTGIGPSSGSGSQVQVRGSGLGPGPGPGLGAGGSGVGSGLGVLGLRVRGRGSRVRTPVSRVWGWGSGLAPGKGSVPGVRGPGQLQAWGRVWFRGLGLGPGLGGGSMSRAWVQV